MRGFSRILASFIVFTMLLSMLPQMPGFLNYAYAANLVVNISRDNNNKYLLAPDSVTLEWNDVPGAASYDLSYYDDQGTLKTKLGITPSPIVKYTVSGLNTDFIYEFTVTANIASSTPQTYKKRVLTGITFEVPNTVMIDANGNNIGKLTESPVNLPGGGRQVGSQPGIRFKWKIPKIYSGGTVGLFSRPDMLDYYINLGTDIAGKNKTQLNIRYSGAISQYIATMYTGTEIRTIADKVDVNSMQPGYIVFDCYGPDASLANPPAIRTTNNAYPNGTDPRFNSTNNNMWDFPKDSNGNYVFNSVNLQNVYYNPDVKPGTVYKMKIQPVFNDLFDSNGVAFLQSSVLGNYTYTPVKFQITKDSANNLLITIFKINQEDADRSSLQNFTYEVEYDTSKYFYNATTSARQTDEFSPGSTVEIYVENKNYNTPYYYRVTAWSPNRGQVLDSNSIDYIISQDSSLPPLPEGVELVSVTPKTGQVFNTFYPSGRTPGSDPKNPYSVKTSDIKIRWRKPANYTDLVKPGADPLYYHILLASSQFPENLQSELLEQILGDDSYSKLYATPSTNNGYREVLKVNIKACTVNGEYLEFTIDGLNLFSKVEPPAVLPISDTNPPRYTQDLTMNTDGYPTYLLPNKVYYAKIYSVKEVGTPNPPQSDISIPISFTTAASLKRNPPSPDNFRITQNGNAAQNVYKPIILEWLKTGIKLKEYTSKPNALGSVKYELYMSDGRYIPASARIDQSLYQDTSIASQKLSFVRVGTADSNGSTGDAAFSGNTSAASTVIDASVGTMDFSNADVVKVFGTNLKPNTAYYFMVRTILTIAGEGDRTSDFSNIATVTTLRGDISNPGNDTLIPRAPADFSIALDGQSNRLVDSSTVTFKWTHLENDVKYTLVRTSLRISGDASYTDIHNNPENRDKKYLDYNGLANGSPENILNFTYDSGAKSFGFMAADLSPNTVFYFNLRAERKVNAGQPIEKTLVSPWVTIPVTTTLIETPELPDIVAGYEVGVSWLENSVYNSSDITVSVNGSTIPRGQVSISESPDVGQNSRYYARITGLQANTSYNLNIRGSARDGNGALHTFNLDIPYTQVDPVTNSNRTVTREPMHEVDIKWKGKDNYKFELAVKTENDGDYTTLGENTDFKYMSVEKPADLAGTNYSMYYARIRGLKSNTKYYIKVRSVEHSAITGNDEYSKYAGPVSTRTEFSQADYDRGDQDNKGNASYSDKVNRFKGLLYWELENSSSMYKIKIRGDRAVSYINTTPESEFTIDLAPAGGSSAARRAVYIPMPVVELLFSRNESINVKTPGSQYVIRPETINLQSSTELKQIKADPEIKETYIYIEVEKTSAQANTFPAGMKPASDVTSLSIQITGMKNNTDEATEKQIGQTLDAYINNGLSKLQNADSDKKSTPQGLNDVINNIVDGVISDFENDIRNLIENPWFGLKKSSRNLTGFAGPMMITMNINTLDKGMKYGYVYQDSKWQKLAASVSSLTGSAVFNAIVPGKFTVLSSITGAIYPIPDGHWASGDISAFISKYDISDIFSKEQFSDVDSNIGVEKSVQLIAKILANGSQTGSSGTTGALAKKLGLDGSISFSIPSRNLTREEMASLVMRVYQIKSGVDFASLKPSRIVAINDDRSIDPAYFKAVELSTDMKFLTLDAKKNFRPKEASTWAQIISALSRLLKAVGEL